MIIDTIDRLGEYAACLPELKKIGKYLETNDISKLPDGKTEIEGNDFYVNVSHGKADPWDDKMFECHQLYVDVQYVFQGAEIIGWLPEGCLSEAVPYDPDGDIAFLDGPATSSASRLLLSQGTAAVFFPGEAHKPSTRISENSEQVVHKAVFKIRMAPEEK